MSILKLYGAEWCPHCRKARLFLEEAGIPYEFIDMDHVEKDVEQKVTEINGGDDWVVPTLEYNGKWRPGKVFEKESFKQDLTELGMSL